MIYLHLALKKRAIIEEFHEKQEQVLSLPLSISVSVYGFSATILTSIYHLKFFARLKNGFNT